MKIKLDSGGAQRSKSTRALKHCLCVLASARFVHLLMCVTHLMLHLAEIRMEASGRPPVQHACQRSGYTDHNLGKSTLRYARTAFFFLAHCCSIFFVDGISAAVRAACPGVASGPGCDATRVTAQAQRSLLQGLEPRSGT